jgi:gliding motility-associated-like protein
MQSGVETGVYEVELLDGNGCLTTLDVEVSATYPAEVSFITGPAEVCFPGADVDFLDLTAGVIGFRRWDFGDGTAASFTGESEEAAHSYLSAGSFEVELSVVNGEGCYSSATEVVEVTDGMSVYVPTAFTPDNDGLNDGFGPVMNGVASFHMWIYDRWGHPVFETQDEDWWWNGSPKNEGRSHKTEIYSWRIEAEGTCNAFEVLQGTVVVLR